jgi:hypothetical protein
MRLVSTLTARSTCPRTRVECVKSVAVVDVMKMQHRIEEPESAWSDGCPLKPERYLENASWLEIAQSHGEAVGHAVYNLFAISLKGLRHGAAGTMQVIRVHAAITS